MHDVRGNARPRAGGRRDYGLVACLLVLGLTTWACVGCGGKGVVPVSGRVTLVGGEPVQGATVVFENREKRLSSSGRTDAEGRFRLTTFKVNDGALPGDYRISIVPPSAADSSQPQPRRVFADKYLSPDSSGLSLAVERGMKECGFELTPAAVTNTKASKGR
jgi:hypothetical protein